jgi:hypothetical protein
MDCTETSTQLDLATESVGVHYGVKTSIPNNEYEGHNDTHIDIHTHIYVCIYDCLSVFDFTDHDGSIICRCYKGSHLTLQ